MPNAIDILDAEYESLKGLPVGEVIDYLAGLGYSEEDAKEAIHSSCLPVKKGTSDDQAFD